MKQEFLKSLNLSDEVIAQIQAENGKDIQAEKDKTKKAQDDMAALNAKISEYENKIKDFEKQDAAGLAEKIKELQKVIDDRKAADDKAIHDKNMSDRLDKVTGEKKYLNEYTRNGILSEFMSAVEDKANAGKSDADLFAQITKDREGIFDSQNKVVEVPGIDPINPGAFDENKARQVMGLPPLK